MKMFDINLIRNQFPITQKQFRNGNGVYKNIIYFDHGASTHAPVKVIEKYTDFLKYFYANVHRGNHYLAMISSELFNNVYGTILRFLNADSNDNAVILTSNTTNALDIAASVMSNYEGITLVSMMEHHSNDLPHRKRSEVVHFGLNPDGSINISDLEYKLSKYKVKLVAVTGASNVTGFMPDIHYIARLSHRHGARILVDAAQLLAHKQINIKPNDDIEHIDFLAGAGHKAYSPFGSAFLLGPRRVLDSAEPYLPGGGTVLYVTLDDVYFDKSPERHQGGTPNIAGAIALSHSLEFIDEIGLENIRKHEMELTDYALKGLMKIDGVSLLGNFKPEDRLGVISFNIDNLSNTFVACKLNYEALIATRNGCFCAHPYLHFLLGLKDTTELRMKLVKGEDVELPGAVRATIGIYNTKEEIDVLLTEIKKISQNRWNINYKEYIPGYSENGILINTNQYY